MGNRKSNGFAQTLATGLGWFSIALGVTELVAPRTLARTLGMEGNERLIAAYGAREVAAGIGILATANPAPWVWGRVAGDGLDLGTLALAFRDDNPRRNAVRVACAAVAGATVLDVICAQQLVAERNARPRATWDYSDRRGMPRPPDEMRGVAREPVALKGKIPERRST